MKKTIIFTLIIALVFAFAACGFSDSDIEDKVPVQDAEILEKPQQDALDFTEDEPVEEQTEEVTIEEQVIYDENDIKVTAKALEYEDWFGPSITVLVENNSQQNITVQTRNSSVNGLMIDTMFSCDVAAGKKANDSITFYKTELDVANIEILKDIEFQLHIFDSDEWENIADSDTITLTTSADPAYVQQCNTDGFVAYEDEAFKIVVQKLDSDDSFWGSELYVYIENNGDKNITVQARDVSINGFMMEPVFSCDVLAGKKAFDSVTFFQSDLDDNGITDITEMEIKFHIFNADSWKDICDSDTVTVTFE